MHATPAEHPHPENQTAGIELRQEGVSLACNRTDSGVPSCTFLVHPDSKKLVNGLWRGRAVQPTPGKRRALFEPFDQTQDKLREFARCRACPEQGRRSRRTAQGTRRACPCGGRGPRQGQHGFGYFCRNKSGSAAGPNPGLSKHQGQTVANARELKCNPEKGFRCQGKLE